MRKQKSSISCLLAVAVWVTSAVMPVHAEKLCDNDVLVCAEAVDNFTNEVLEVSIEVDTEGDVSQFDEINAYLEAHGREVLNNFKIRSSVTLGRISRLAQADSRWKDVVMQKEGAKIGDAGCCLTSFTIVRNCISGTSDTPDMVNSKLGDGACPFEWDTAKTTYGYSILTKMRNDSGISNESARLTVVGAIDEYSRPVMIGMKYNNRTHFVVGYGYTGDGDIIICDPAGRNYT